MADVRAKRNKVLESLKTELSKGFIERDCEINGHKFKLRSLSEDDEIWADAYVRSTTTVAIYSSRRSPRLAASIKSIDGVPLESLFEYPDDMSKEAREALADNPVQKRYWLYTQMLYFLAEESSRAFINKLWEQFEAMEEERNKAIGLIPN